MTSGSDHARAAPGLSSAVAEQYHAVWSRPWDVWTAAVLVAAVNVFLFAFDRPWTASDGVRNWGDWVLLRGLALGERPDLLAPWLYSGSLIDLGVLFGAAASALLGREFAVRVPPAGELVKGALGGSFMGVGAVLAFGCNIGGFFSATSALSLAGIVMMCGLLLGTLAGTRYLLWELEHHPSWSSGRSLVMGAVARDSRSWQPLAGGCLMAALLSAPVVYGQLGYVPQGVFLLFGVTFGVIFQRSRFCLVRAFREPFMTGDGEHTRAAALAVVLCTAGFAILKFTDLKDRGEWVLASAGAGALAGGVLFGAGMAVAGGCGAGSIWRAGEGQVKLWVALLAFALSASAARLILSQAGLLRRLGQAVFLPSILGWSGALGVVVLLMLGWATFAAWNEATGRLAALR